MAEKERKFGESTTYFPFEAGSEHSFQNDGYIHIERILAGKQLFRICGQERRVSAGDILVVQPYDEVYSCAEESGLIQGFVFDSPRYFDSIGLPPLFRTKTFIGKDAVLSRICEAIQEEYVNQSAFHETALNALTTEFVIRLYRNYGEKNLEVAGIAVPNAGEARNFGKQRVVREALAYIYENCQDGISTRDIAQHVNVSLSYLCRCFSEVCGETVLSYSDRIRCRKAHEDLTLGTLSVGEIAAKYHFSSLSYFNRRYRKFYGTNPAATLADAKMRHRR